MDYNVIKYSQFPQYEVFAAYFSSVSNQKEILSNLLAANSDFDFCFVNADNIASLEQLYSAIYKSLLDTVHKRTRSKSLHSEIIFNLSPNKNIMESLKRFGVSLHASRLLILKVQNTENCATNHETTFGALTKIIEGTSVRLNDDIIWENANLDSLKENYKLTDTDLEDRARTTRLLVGITQLKGL